MPVLRALVSGLAAALTLLAAAGCATPQPWLAPLPPASLGSALEARQQVTLERGEDTRSLQVALKADATTLTLIGLSPLGQRLFTLVWDGQSAQLSTRIDELEGLDPYWILSDLQMSFWPLAPLRAALPADLQLTEHGSARSLWRGEKLLWYRSAALDDIWHSEVLLYNVRLGYRLSIRPLAIGSAAP